mmetsp:Transcript_25820/g.86785  ORF Transcript_25820/g.86785 Transcript_25820/m.86785 type:complete len:261 (+) Transcript_25820:943-1725(+)
MPNNEVSSNLVETAATCCRTTSASVASGMFAKSHVLIVAAFIIVSAVVNDLDTTITSVSDASKSAVCRAKSTGSTLATNFKVRPFAAAAHFGSAFNASNKNSGPRYDPPMPMATTVFNTLPVAPRHSPDRTLAEKSLTRSRTSCTNGTWSTPSTTMGAEPLGARKATWYTARSSVKLILSPANMLSRLASRSAARASWSRCATVSVVTFCRAKSKTMPSASTQRAALRSPSLRRSRRCTPCSAAASSLSCAHAGDSMTLA